MYSFIIFKPLLLLFRNLLHPYSSYKLAKGNQILCREKYFQLIIHPKSMYSFLSDSGNIKFFLWCVTSPILKNLMLIFVLMLLFYYFYSVLNKLKTLFLKISYSFQTYQTLLNLLAMEYTSVVTRASFIFFNFCSESRFLSFFKRVTFFVFL